MANFEINYIETNRARIASAMRDLAEHGFVTIELVSAGDGLNLQRLHDEMQANGWQGSEYSINEIRIPARSMTATAAPVDGNAFYRIVLR